MNFVRIGLEMDILVNLACPIADVVDDWQAHREDSNVYMWILSIFLCQEIRKWSERMTGRCHKDTDQTEISNNDQIKVYLSITTSQMDYNSFSKGLKPEVHSATSHRNREGMCRGSEHSWIASVTWESLCGQRAKHDQGHTTIAGQPAYHTMWEEVQILF